MNNVSYVNDFALMCGCVVIGRDGL